MRYILILTISVFSFHLNAQDSKHDLFGLNMDLDWYSLTNYSALTYFSANENSSSSYIVLDFDYHLNQVDIELETFNFSEYLIAFEKGLTATGSVLEKLSPILFLGRYNYSSTSKFIEKAFEDAEFLKNKLISVHGNPELKIEKTEFRVYKWVVDDVTIIVNSVQDDLTTTLTYLVNSR